MPLLSGHCDGSPKVSGQIMSCHKEAQMDPGLSLNQ